MKHKSFITFYKFSVTEDETVVQFHPKKSEYININPNCLHLWRKHDQEYELPPTLMV